MKILVTGGTGFLGHHLAKRLKKEGHHTRILKEKKPQFELHPGTEIEVFEGDIRNFDEVEKAVKGSEIVFNLVGLISYFGKLNQLQHDINVNGTRNVVSACLKHKVKRLIHVSSDVTAGVKEEGLADEENLYNLFPYRINYCDTKFLGEVEILKGVIKGLDAVIVCPASMYGEGDTRKIKTDMTFNFKFPMNLFYIDGGIAVADVLDVAEGLIKAWKIGKKGERYILSGENLSFYKIRKIIAKELGKEPPSIKIPNWVLLFLSYAFLFAAEILGVKPKLTPEMVRFNQLKLYYSNEKAKKELGIEFRPFRESIKRAVKWYKENGYL